MTIYHIPLPNAGYFMVLNGANPGHFYTGAPFNAHFYEGWLGLWLDRNSGLFATAPIFALVPAGFFVLWKRARLLALQILVIGTPLLSGCRQHFLLARWILLLPRPDIWYP